MCVLYRFHVKEKFRSKNEVNKTLTFTSFRSFLSLLSNLTNKEIFELILRFRIISPSLSLSILSFPI